MRGAKFFLCFISVCLLSLCFCVPLCLADPTEKEPVKEKSEPAVEEKGAGEKEPMTKQYEQEMIDLKDKIEKQRQEIETMRKYEQEIGDLKAKMEKQRKEEQERVQKQKAEIEKYAQEKQIEKTLEVQKEKLKKPAMNLKFTYGPLSGTEIPVALVHKGDKVTVRVKVIRNQGHNGFDDNVYIRVGPPDKIEIYGTVNQDAGRNLNQEDSFSITYGEETGVILYLGSTCNKYRPQQKGKTYSIDMDIYETNQWNKKPKNLL